MKSRLVLLVLALLVYVGLTIYIGWHGERFLDFWGISVPAGIYWTLLAVLALAYMLGRSPVVPGPPGRLLKVIGSYYFAVLEFAVILLPLGDLAAWLLKLAGFPPAVYFGGTGSVVLVILIVLLAKGYWNAWTPIVRTYRARVGKRAGRLRQLRVAVASDIHLGNIVGKRHLARLVKAVDAMKPDLILLPGDLIDDSIEPYIRNGMSEVMKQLQAKYGVYAVLGNHEYYGGHIEEHIRQMESIGIRVLRDETVSVEDAFYIAGRKDKTAESFETGGRMAVDRLLSGLDPSKPILLMDHQPYHFDKAAAAGADVLLCGHTHRGQFAPNHWITGRLFELDWGYMLKEKMHVVVSSGFGTWGPPIRIASRSEVIELILDFEEAE
ncbi:metallophosphoesterase [Paenibacillus sp. RC84]|uniref:metallophosphoesterase n=1 Tax=Paenibacillus sp. RC84 TaxID=3156252 RepID=UPI003510FDC7